MNASITIEGIREAVSHLNYRSRRTPKYKLLETLMQFYPDDGSLETVTRIDEALLIRRIWDLGPEADIHSKRRNFQSIKSAVNTDLMRLFKEDKNPQGISIGPTNTFVMSDNAKDRLLTSFSDALKSGAGVSLDSITDILGLISEFLSDMQSISQSDGKQEVKKLLDLIKNLATKVGADQLDDYDIIRKDEIQSGGDDAETEGDAVEIEEIDEDEILEVDEDFIAAYQSEDSPAIPEDEIVEAEDTSLENLEEVDPEDIIDAEDAPLEELEEFDLDDLVETDTEEPEDTASEEEIQEDDAEVEEIDEEDVIDAEDAPLEDLEEVDPDDLVEIDEGPPQDMETDEEVNEEDIDIEEIDTEDIIEAEEAPLEDLEEVDPDDIVEADETEEQEPESDESISEDDAEVEEIDADDIIDAEDEDIEEVEEVEEDSVQDAPEVGMPLDNLSGPRPEADPRQLSEQFDGYLGALERHYNQYLMIPEGTYRIGGDRSGLNSGVNALPDRSVSLNRFYCGKYPVTNALFEVFIERTGYRTTAERVGYSIVYRGRFQRTKDQRTGLMKSSWKANYQREQVQEAFWYQPFGPGSTLHQKRNHPVVHVSMEDALAFAAWTGKRLPTEIEWEAAARTEKGMPYPWGDSWITEMCNVEKSAVADTTPVDKFPFAENSFGIADVIGNILEWTADETRPPQGQAGGTSYHIAKGGSWISDETVCGFSRFRLPVNQTSNILGFRCVVD